MLNIFFIINFTKVYWCHCPYNLCIQQILIRHVACRLSVEDSLLLFCGYSNLSYEMSCMYGRQFYVRLLVEGLDSWKFFTSVSFKIWGGNRLPYPATLPFEMLQMALALLFQPLIILICHSWLFWFSRLYPWLLYSLVLSCADTLLSAHT